MTFHRRSNSERSTRCLAIAAADQSRVPSACSMRGTSSKVKGLHSARHVQNSDANWSNESDFPWAKERGNNRNNPNSTRDIGLTAFLMRRSLALVPLQFVSTLKILIGDAIHTGPTDVEIANHYA